MPCIAGDGGKKISPRGQFWSSRAGKPETERLPPTFPASHLPTENGCLPDRPTPKPPSNNEQEPQEAQKAHVPFVPLVVSSLFLAEFGQRDQGPFDPFIERMAATETDVVAELSAW